MKYKSIFGVFVAFAGLGLLFSASSAYDSISYLDREIHAISCSFVPGMGRDATGQSGCYTVMMSPFSSVLREVTWGGIPIALLSLSVFAYLVFLGIEMLLTPISKLDPRRTYYVIAASALPALVSLIYLAISVWVIGEVCKTCVGIYVASFGGLIAAVIGHKAVRRESEKSGDRAEKKSPLPWGYYMRSFFEGVVFVALPLIVYLAVKPAYAAEEHSCGNLLHQDDPHGVMVPLQRVPGGVRAIEVVDPLCPACKLFKDRIESSSVGDKLDLSAVMLPLEADCNWMVTQTLHPGACMVSEAVLCAGEGGAEVIDWALDNQEDLRRLAQKDKGLLKAEIKKAFPQVGRCVGSTEARLKVNRSLRWIVSNSSRVMTPQLFVSGIRLCDEDTDLGLEYALNRLIAQGQGSTLRADKEMTAAPVPVPSRAEDQVPGAATREDETSGQAPAAEASDNPVDSGAAEAREAADAAVGGTDSPTDDGGAEAKKAMEFAGVELPKVDDEEDGTGGKDADSEAGAAKKEIPNSAALEDEEEGADEGGGAAVEKEGPQATDQGEGR